MTPQQQLAVRWQLLFGQHAVLAGDVVRAGLTGGVDFSAAATALDGNTAARWPPRSAPWCLPTRSGPSPPCGPPGEFFRLRDGRIGAVVLVDRADGSTVSFRETRLASRPKTPFPTSGIYLPTAGPELRLVTCRGGSFDAASGHYRDNVVAFSQVVT